MRRLPLSRMNLMEADMMMRNTHIGPSFIYEPDEGRHGDRTSVMVYGPDESRHDDDSKSGGIRVRPTTASEVC